MIVCRPSLFFAMLFGATPRLLAEGDAERALLCIAGKSIPQLYLLGAAKAGTTSIAKDLFQAGFMSPQKDGWGHLVKELHSFDAWCGGQWHLCRPMPADVKQNWAANFQIPCGTKALMDCTPDHFRYPGLPPMMKDLYGQASHKLSFLVVLRDPLSRMQSNFYHNKRGAAKKANLSGKKHAGNGRFLGKAWEGKARQRKSKKSKVYSSRGVNRTVNVKWLSLQDWVDTVRASSQLEALRDNNWVGAELTPGIELVYRSLYGLQLIKWLEVFPADQFTVLPRGKYFGSLGLARGLIQHVALSMGLEVDVNVVAQPGHRNSASHSSVEEDLNTASREWLTKEFFDPDVERLSRLLAASAEEGLHLYGHEAKLTPEHVHDYLISSW